MVVGRVFDGSVEGDAVVEVEAAAEARVPREDPETLIKRGDSSFQLFAIEYGAVEVCSSKEETVATLGVGQVVGEIGVAKHGLRKASVEATQAAGGFFLTNSQVQMVRREAPGFEQKLQPLVERRGF